jgi:hypothetical protein
MVTKELKLDDGRELRFYVSYLEAGEASNLSPNFPAATEPTLEVFSFASAGDRTHPDFLGCRFFASALIDPHAIAEHSRHGLPLTTNGDPARLDPEASAWLLRRLEDGRVEEVDFVPTIRSRRSPLAG